MKFKIFEYSPIPIWINILLIVLILFMAIQGYLFYFDQTFLLDAGINFEGAPNLNIIYTTAGRLLAMTAAFILVLYTQNPHQYFIVLFLSVLKDGQQAFIDPLFPYLNSASPAIDFGMHFAIVAVEIWALFVVYRIIGKENFKTRKN